MKSVRVFNDSGGATDFRIAVVDPVLGGIDLDWPKAVANGAGYTYDVWTVLSAGQELYVHNYAQPAYALVSGAELSA